MSANKIEIMKKYQEYDKSQRLKQWQEWRSKDLGRDRGCCGDSDSSVMNKAISSHEFENKLLPFP